MATVKINEKLVSIIKDKRKKKKLTQKDMAEYLQISFSNYQRLEANKYETYEIRSRTDRQRQRVNQ